MKNARRITAAFNYRYPEWSVLRYTFHWLIELCSVVRGKDRIYPWKSDVIVAEEIMLMCIINKRYLSYFYLKILHVGRFYAAVMHNTCKCHITSSYQQRWYWIYYKLGMLKWTAWVIQETTVNGFCLLFINNFLNFSCTILYNYFVLIENFHYTISKFWDWTCLREEHYTVFSINCKWDWVNGQISEKAESQTHWASGLSASGLRYNHLLGIILKAFEDFSQLNYPSLKSFLNHSPSHLS